MGAEIILGTFLASYVGALVTLAITVGLVLLPFLVGAANSRLTRLLWEAKRQNQLLQEQNRILKSEPAAQPKQDAPRLSAGR